MITKFAVQKIRLEMYGDILLTMLGEQYQQYFQRYNLYCFTTVSKVISIEVSSALHHDANRGHYNYNLHAFNYISTGLPILTQERYYHAAFL